MKLHRIGMGAAALALAAVLAGCVPMQSSAPQNSSSSTQSQNEEQQSSTQEETANNPFSGLQTQQEETPKTVDLTVTADGKTETVTAEVYTGSGYTIAVPQDWVRDQNEPQWNPYGNEDVELTVRFYTGRKSAEVIELFQRDEDEYTFESALQTSLSNVETVTQLRGTKMDDGQLQEMVVYFLDTDQGCYGLILECPSDQADSYGGYLGAMANSFTLLTANR